VRGLEALEPLGCRQLLVSMRDDEFGPLYFENHAAAIEYVETSVRKVGASTFGIIELLLS
jgi:hypothetical protein